MITPEPSVAPAARVASNVSGRSSWSGPTKTPAAPPSRIARIASGPRPPLTPPPSSMRSRSVAPNSTSYVPGRSTWPDRQKSFGPVEPSVPMPA
jgi:hypothetical protein